MNLPNITIVDKYKVRIDAFECKKCGKVPATTIDLRPYAGQYVRIWLDDDGTYSLDPRRNHFWQMVEFQVPEQEYKQVDSGEKDPETKESIMVPEAIPIDLTGISIEKWTLPPAEIQSEKAAI